MTAKNIATGEKVGKKLGEAKRKDDSFVMICTGCPRKGQACYPLRAHSSLVTTNKTIEDDIRKMRKSATMRASSL